MGYLPLSTNITGTLSISTVGTLSANTSVISLVNDLSAPGTTKYYGTNSAGTKGWFTLSANSITIGTSYPLSSVSTAGNLFWNSETGQTFIYYVDINAGQWVEIGTSSGLVSSLYVPRGRYQNLYIPAGALTPATTNGPAASVIAMSGNSIINYDALAFDGATSEYSWFNMSMPDVWDLGSFKATFTWSPYNTGSGSVVWGIAAATLSTNQTLNATLGTEVSATGVAFNSSFIYTTSATEYFTTQRTPISGDTLFFRVRRLPSDTSDTMTQDAMLLGVKLQWKESSNDISGW